MRRLVHLRSHYRTLGCSMPNGSLVTHTDGERRNWTTPPRFPNLLPRANDSTAAPAEASLSMLLERAGLDQPTLCATFRLSGWTAVHEQLQKIDTTLSQDQRTRLRLEVTTVCSAEAAVPVDAI